MSDNTVLETVTAMTVLSVDNCNLQPRELMLVRLAAMAASDAQPLSYLFNVDTAYEVGITVEDVQALLIAVAPIIGTTRTVAAAANIEKALGFAVALAKAELDAEQAG